MPRHKFPKGNVPWNKGKKNVYSTLALKMMSRAKKNKYKGENNPFFGKHHTSRIKKIIGLASKGRILTYNHKNKIRESVPKLEEHWNWQGGKSKEEYGLEFDSALKEQIRFRDKYKCRSCQCTQLENGEHLIIHHIDFNKKNNNVNNLIAICRPCHAKIHNSKQGSICLKFV